MLHRTCITKLFYKINTNIQIAYNNKKLFLAHITLSSAGGTSWAHIVALPDSAELCPVGLLIPVPRLKGQTPCWTQLVSLQKRRTKT